MYINWFDIHVCIRVLVTHFARPVLATCLGINLDPDDVQVISHLRIALALLCA